SFHPRASRFGEDVPPNPSARSRVGLRGQFVPSGIRAEAPRAKFYRGRTVAGPAAEIGPQGAARRTRQLARRANRIRLLSGIFIAEGIGAGPAYLFSGPVAQKEASAPSAD